MIVRSEFSFNNAYGSVEAVLRRLPHGGVLADDTCYGHVPFALAATKANKPFALGWRVRMCETLEDRAPWQELIIVARSSEGLRQLYAAVELAHGQFRYVPRLTVRDVAERDGAGWVLALGAARSGPAPLSPPPGRWAQAYWAGIGSPVVPQGVPEWRFSASDNFYPSPGDREAWLFARPRAYVASGVAPGHILLPEELEAHNLPESTLRVEDLSVPLPKADNIRFGVPDPMRELSEQCAREMETRGLDRDPVYRERLARELELIAEKSFGDYFLVIGDMLRWAKRRMLVGPARGSSCGSLVCWLTRITEVDPIVHGLIFERFIDANRFDLPDIDIDFPDETRHEIVSYLGEKYGQANVAHIGTVLRYKPKSAMTDVAKALRVPDSDLNALKDVLIERSSGDSRVNDCLRDSFETLEAGKQLLTRHPGMALSIKLEGAAKTHGTHAAGLIVCNAPVVQYCAIGRGRVAQLDKKSAEALNMLKIDALGLRTLSVIQTACDAAGIDRETLYTLPLEDPRAFQVLNAAKFSGIFQFEGLALQQLAREIEFREFSDIAAIGALARPGPLSSGETHKWIQRHEHREDPTPAHPALEELTRDTLGIIMYQEQVMMITRTLAGFSWKETAQIRKLMSARQGDESFFKWTERFVEGCVSNGVEREEAEKIWKAINTFGSWAFNKSHSVAYGIVSYWCCWLKAHYPLAFALGCLTHAKDDDSAIVQLRELTREGLGFVPLDERSRAKWSIQDGELIGPLLGVKGIGPVSALEIENRRRNGLSLKPSHLRLLANGSVFADIYPTRSRFPDEYAQRVFPTPNVVQIEDVEDHKQTYTVIGRLRKKSLRDVNEDKSVAKRGGRLLPGQSKWLLATIEDDTARIPCMIDRFDYERLGAAIVERAALGQWLAIQGTLNNRFRAINVEHIAWWNGNEWRTQPEKDGRVHLWRKDSAGVWCRSTVPAPVGVGTGAAVVEVAGREPGPHVERSHAVEESGRGAMEKGRRVGEAQ